MMFLRELDFEVRRRRRLAVNPVQWLPLVAVVLNLRLLLSQFVYTHRHALQFKVKKLL